MDDLLRRLNEAPLPVALSRIDDAVIMQLSARQSEARSGKQLLSAAAIFALGVGYAGGSFAPAPAKAAESSIVFAENTLAPSTLLDFR